MKTLDIEALLAFHRALFGDARMEEDDSNEAGDDGTDDAESPADDDGADDKGADDDKPLGPKGEKALAALKDELKKTKDELATLRKGPEARQQRSARLQAARDEAERLKEQLAKLQGKEAEYDAERKQRQTEQQALATANARILRSEVRAAAAGKLADPADALRLLDVDKFEVDDDGNVDEDEIAEAIEALIKKKPYLAVQDGKRFKGKADGGTRKESAPAQLTEAEVKRLYKEKKYSEIEKARTEGRLNDVLGVEAAS